MNGMIAGFRTLFWAIVLLLLFVYALSVLLLQLLKRDEIEVFYNGQSIILFQSLWRTMFYAFRCFLSDGTLVNGTSLVSILEERYGAIFSVPFLVCILFIVFGIFNIISAIFLENAIESARAKRELSE